MQRRRTSVSEDLINIRRLETVSWSKCQQTNSTKIPWRFFNTESLPVLVVTSSDDELYLAGLFSDPSTTKNTLDMANIMD
jgi:hypothetical protein